MTHVLDGFDKRGPDCEVSEAFLDRVNAEALLITWDRLIQETGGAVNPTRFHGWKHVGKRPKAGACRADLPLLRGRPRQTRTADGDMQGGPHLSGAVRT